MYLIKNISGLSLPDGKILIFNNKIYCGSGTSVNFIFTIGTYTGDGTSSKFINLGYTPEFILVFNQGAFTSISRSIYGGLCLRNSPTIDTDSTENALEITDNGFNVCYLHDTYNENSTNRNNGIYNYIAY